MAGNEDLPRNSHLTRLSLRVDPSSTPESAVLGRTNQGSSTGRSRGNICQREREGVREQRRRGSGLREQLRQLWQNQEGGRLCREQQPRDRPSDKPQARCPGLALASTMRNSGLRIQGAPGLLDVNEKIHSPSPTLQVQKQSPK